MAQISPERDVTTPGSDLKVRVELAPALLQARTRPVEEWTSAIEGFLAGLIDDLATPATPRVEVASGDESRLGRVPFIVRLGDHVCLPSLPSTITAEDSDDDIRRAILWTIYDHRHFWAVDARRPEQSARPYLETMASCNCALPADAGIDLQTSERLLADRDAGLSVTLSHDLFDSLVEQGASEGDPLPDQLDRMRDDLFYESGVVLPFVRIDRHESLGPDEFHLMINGVRCPPESCVPDGCLAVNASEQMLLDETGLPTHQLETRAAHWEFSSTPDSEFGLARNTLAEAGLTYWSRAEYIALCVAAEIRRHLGAFINQKVVDHLLFQVRQSWPRLMDSVEARWDVAWLTRMLRSVVAEGVSVRDIRSILEHLLSFHGELQLSDEAYLVLLPPAGGPCPVPAGLDGPDAYANALRLLLRHQTSGPSVEGNSLWYFDVGTDVESRLRGPALGPDERADLLMGVLSALSAWGIPSGKWVLMTAFDTRPKLRRALVAEFPWLKVLCRQEVAPEYRPYYLGSVGLGTNS